MSPKLIVEWIESIRGEISVTQACAWVGLPRATYIVGRPSIEACVRITWWRKFVNSVCSINFVMDTGRSPPYFRGNIRLTTNVCNGLCSQRKGLQCCVKVKKRKATGQPAHIAEHLLKRQFEADAPMQKLVTDITYLPFGGKTLYLASILDLYNGEVVAYSIADKQDTALVLDTLSQLPSLPGTMLHSDQGSVYTSQAYQEAIKRKSIIMSMSRKGTPADNARIESFHSTLKSETFYLEGLTCTTTAIVVQIVREYITYYNSIRIQTKLNNQSPIDYRRLAA